MSIENSSSGTVGSGNYIVKRGDCIESIAEAHGIFWETIWDHEKNQKLREKRKDPNVLLPGDKVFVPKKELKEERGQTKKRHRFRVKGVPSKLQLTLLDYSGEPRASEPYKLIVDGNIINGQLDGSGKLKVEVPPRVRNAVLYIGNPEDEERYNLSIGELDPITELSGSSARLNNLGYACGDPKDENDEQLSKAIARFQQDHELEPTGIIDDRTLQKLDEAYE